ncbi:hypothetical protein D3C87_1434960 [compost metagenome]
MFTHTHPCIITLRHDVGQSVVEDQLDLDVGILRQKFPEFGPEDIGDRVLGGDDTDRSRRLFPQFVQRVDMRFDLVEMWTDPV